MPRPTPDELRKIAQELDELGVGKAEAFPVEKWRKNGWPEEPLAFRIVDLELRLISLRKELRKRPSKKKA